MSGVEGPTYIADASRGGPVRDRELPGLIGVLESLDNHMPIGIASHVGRTDSGLSEGALRDHGADLSGRWVIVDREFAGEASSP